MPYRTDLAIESVQLHGSSVPGVEVEEYTAGNLEISRVTVTSAEAAQKIGKEVGEYITFTVPSFSSALEVTEEEMKQISKQIATLLPPEGLILVVGLGNNDITPDAIGPRTVRQILATRHIDAELARQSGLENLRAVAAIAPGVLGQTGIETSEIIKSLVDSVHPVALIVVDALAARSLSRLGNTIQVSNTGIAPGSGVMNKRKELSRNTMQIPVVSMGIPTVVDASTFVSDLLGSEEEDEQKLRQILGEQGKNMMITPREIDVLIGHACKTLSLSLNKALQPNLTLEEIGYMVS